VWDATGIPVTTFAPVALAGVAMILLVIGLDLSAARRRENVPVTDIESSAFLS
jgi:hypothetical protein